MADDLRQNKGRISTGTKREGANMKRILLILAAVLLCGMLSSCGKEKVEVGVTVTPDANGDGYITSDEVDLRDVVVQYMYEMANIEWTAGPEINYTAEGFGKLVYEPGKKYYGMVYNNNSNGLENFQKVLDDTNTYIGEDTSWHHSPGNSCATSIKHAWWIVSPTVEYGYSADLMPYYTNTNVAEVGNIAWNTYNGSNTTKSVLKNTPKEDIMEAYALTKPGDAMDRYLDDYGHALMVTKETLVVRDSSGKVLPAKSYLYLTDQNNKLNDTRKYPSSWTVDNPVSFVQAYMEGYLPVTAPELRDGKTPVPDIEFTDGPTEQDLEMSTLNGVITSNYRIFAVRAEITKGKQVVASASYHPYEREVNLDAVSSELKMWELPEGKYTLTVEVEAGLGKETILQMKYKKADAKDLVKKYQDDSLVQVELIDGSTVEDLQSSNIRGTLNCNYSMLTIRIEILNTAGEVVDSLEVNPCAKTYLLDKVSTDLAMWELPAGDYTVDIQVETGVGFQSIMKQEYTKAS